MLFRSKPAVSNDPSGDIGGDAKVGVTKGLTADFTYNTDFAQVEDDEAQVNLTRFSLFFPEKREFFLEGADYFAFGAPGGGGGGGAFFSTAFIGIFFPDLTNSSRCFFSFSASRNGLTFCTPAASSILDAVFASRPASLTRRRNTSLVTSNSFASDEMRFLPLSVMIRVQSSIRGKFLRPFPRYSPSVFFLANNDSSSENFPDAGAATTASAPVSIPARGLNNALRSSSGMSLNSVCP